MLDRDRAAQPQHVVRRSRAGRFRRSGRAARRRSGQILSFGLLSARARSVEAAVEQRKRVVRARQKVSACHNLTCASLSEVDSNNGMPAAKLFLGHRLRRLRREQGLSQTDMAASLGVSPSYLNHLERNQRPVTAGAAAQAGRDLRDRCSRRSPSGGGHAHRAGRAGRDLLRRDAQRPWRAALRACRAGPQCAVRRRRHRPALRRAEGGGPQPGLGRQTATRAGWSRPKIGCATISSSTATIIRNWSRRPRRSAARSATRCRWPSRCGGG